MKRRTKSFLHILQKVFGSLLEQELHLNFRSWHERFVVLTWIGGVMFLSYSYKSLLLSFLSFRPTKGVYDIADLSRVVMDGSHECFTFPNSYIIRALKKSSDLDTRVIGESLEKNNVAVFNLYDIADHLKGMDVDKPRWAIVESEVYLAAYESVLYISQDSFLTENIAIAMKKSFCCKKRLDETIHRVFEAGLTKKFLNERYLRETSKLKNYRRSHEAVSVLTLVDLTGAFQFLIVGLILSCVVFAAEYFRWKKFHSFVKRNTE